MELFLVYLWNIYTFDADSLTDSGKVNNCNNNILTKKHRLTRNRRKLVNYFIPDKEISQRYHDVSN